MSKNFQLLFLMKRGDTELYLRSYRSWSRSFNQEVVEKRRGEVETEMSNHRAKKTTYYYIEGSISSKWSAWTDCSKPCGGGTKTRSRLCQGSPCPGGKPQIQDCNTHSCDLGRSMIHKLKNIKLDHFSSR